eukprot:m.165984 g.165984  ORF g.165984 m.165984 type:complete len:1214 (-) comp12632_c0_seq1:303-3944(-)
MADTVYMVTDVDDESGPVSPVLRNTSTSDLDGTEGTLQLVQDSNFNPDEFLGSSADVEIFSRDEIVNDAALLDMVRRNVFPNRNPPPGTPQWIDYVLVAHLPLPGPALLSTAGLAEIWERRCGRLTEVTSDHVTYYLSDDAIMSMEHSAFKSAIHRHNFVHDLTVVYKMQVAHILGTKELSANESVTAFTLIHATPMAVLAAADRLKWKVQLRVEAVKAARRKIIAVNDHKDEIDTDGDGLMDIDEDDGVNSDDELEEDPNSIKNRYLRFIRRIIPLSTGMTESMSVKEAKYNVYHNFNVSRIHLYSLYDEDFQTFLDNVGSLRFFCAADRSFFVHDAMLSARYIHHREYHDKGYDKSKVGIESMLNRGKFESAFPPHLPAPQLTSVGDAGASTNDGNGNGNNDNTGTTPPPSYHEVIGPSKDELVTEWATYSKIWAAQPLDKIRKYFGAQVGFYYFWLEYYTVCLFIPSLFGLLSLLYGLATFMVDPSTGRERQDVKEVCENDRIMCGLCSRCETWKLSDFCNAYETGYIVDNEFSIPFSFAIAIWSTVFIDAWQRVRTARVLKWNLSSETENAGSQLRPQFKGVPDTDPLTGQTDQVMPTYTAVKRYALSLSVMFTMIGVVVAAIIGTIVYRVAVKVALASRQGEGTADIVAVLTAAVINLVVILILNEVYKAMAIMLTDYENHKSRTDWNSWLVFKVFIFQFVNTNASLVYIAIIKPLWVHIYSLDQYGEDTIVEQCAAYGCKLELALNLLIIMGGKQVVQSIGETYGPRIKRWFESWLQAREDRKVAKGVVQGHRVDQRRRHTPSPVDADAADSRLSWEKQSRLAKDDYFTLFDDFNELALQFGFCTLYTTALPITPILALVNNIFEVRVDAKKQLNVFQRATPRFSTNINVWRVIFRMLSFAGVLMTGLVMAITSDFIPKLVYQNENHGSLDGFINSTMWFNQDDQCWVRSFWVREDVITCIDPSVPNCLTTAGQTQVSTDQVTALSYQYWVARLIFIVIYEHVVYTIKIVLEIAIADVSPNTQRIEKYHDSVTQRVSRFDDLHPRVGVTMPDGGFVTAGASAGDDDKTSLSAPTDPLVDAHADFFNTVTLACQRFRYHEHHHLIVPDPVSGGQSMASVASVKKIARRLSTRKSPSGSASAGAWTAGDNGATTSPLSPPPASPTPVEASPRVSAQAPMVTLDVAVDDVAGRTSSYSEAMGDRAESTDA